MNPTRSLTRRTGVKPILLLLAVWAICPAAGGETLERALACPELNTSSDPTGHWTVLDLPGGRMGIPFGAPAVPSMRLKVALPEGLGVEDVRWEIDEQQSLALPRPVLPYAGDQALTQPEPPTTDPDPAIYASDELYPALPAQLVDILELSNGARFAVVEVCPIRVRPATHELTWAKRGRLILTLSARPAQRLLPRLRAALPGAGSGSGEPASAGRVLLAEHGLAPTEIPSVDGSPIVYAIVCPADDAMASAWQALADWKTACGYPTAVFRTDWIDQHYPAGADQPERIREFLRDAYLHWGLRWALIGADPTRIPVRYARSWAYVPSGNGTDIATDMYYACLEGNWDADGDGVFGESNRNGNTGDTVDFTPEIQVGRVSARSATEVDDYLHKYFAYARTPALDGYLDRILMLGEVLFHAEWTRTSNGGHFDCEETNCAEGSCRKSSDGQLVCVYTDGANDLLATGDQIRTSLGVPYQQDYLLERFEHWNSEIGGLNAQLESSSSALARLSEGYNFVHHVGHGDRDRWAVGDGRIETGQLSNLTNGAGNHYFWAYGINCNSAAVDFDCFGERMIMLPEAGAVGYIGCTNADFPSSARGFAEDFYDFVLGPSGSTLGDGLAGCQASNAPSEPNVENESINRFLLYTQILLGEPGMTVWRGTPSAMTAQLVEFGDREVPLGRSSITVSVASGAPVQGARVCVQKAGELYAVGLTGIDGRVALPFWPATQGAFDVTVTAKGHLETVIHGTVVPAISGPALVVDALGLIDDGTAGSAGNDNGRIEVGETIRVRLTLANAGVATANNVQAVLALGADAPAGCVTVSDGDAAIASIPAGESASDDQAFLLAYAAAPPPAAFGDASLIRIPFRLTLSSTSGSASLDLFLELARPLVRVSTNRLTDSGTPQVKKLWIGVHNNGEGEASHLTGRLISADSHDIIVQTPSVGSHDIAPGDTALVGPFLVRIIDVTGKLRFELIDTSPTPDDTLHDRVLDLKAPSAPDSLTLSGLRAAMRLTWNTVEAPGDDPVLGFKIYRVAGVGTPPFPEVVGDILEGHRYFNDSGLAELSRYSYYVAAVDAGGNLGANSAVQAAYTSPGASPGWPHLALDFTKASPLICELDGATSRGREIVFATEKLYAFHGDGTEVNDGDHLDRSTGPFGVVGPNHQVHPFWAKPAAADIDGDGEVEVLAISFAESDTTKRGELFCWGTWGGEPKWAYTFPKWWRSWDSPVLADLDSPADGKLEVIFSGGAGSHAGVYVFRHDGTPYGNPTNRGLLKDLGAKDLYQSPAIGDVDGNGEPDLTIATRTTLEADGALWVLNRNGEPLPGFNNLKFSALPAPNNLAQITTAPVSLCDVDGAAGDEIFVVTTKRLWCFTKNAQLLWKVDLSGTYNLATYELLPEPVLGDINNNGRLDVVLVDPAGKLRVVDAATGLSVAPFPKQLDATARYGSCILANVDADPLPEIIFGDSKQHVFAYRYDGELAAGFPINSGGDLVRQSLAAWDVDHDGYQNLVVQAMGQQQLSVLQLPGVVFPSDPGDMVRRNPWPMRRRDARNTGRYSTNSPVPVQLALESPEVSESGEVRLAWISVDPVTSFRIRRAAGGAEEALVGEVPGRSGSGPQRYAFADTPPEAGSYVYRVNPVLLDGGEAAGARIEVTVGWVSSIRLGLHRVSPDPLTPGRVATISFGIPGTASSRTATRLAIFDVQGRRVRSLIDESRPAGIHVVSWDGRDDGGRRVATGLYLLRLETQGALSQRRLLVIR